MILSGLPGIDEPPQSLRVGWGPGLFTTQDQQGVLSLHIEDGPSRSWRGLLVDSARHFTPFGLLKRTVEEMASIKLQSVRREIQRS